MVLFKVSLFNGICKLFKHKILDMSPQYKKNRFSAEILEWLLGGIWNGQCLFVECV